MKYIAGKDAERNDLSDWDIPVIPVWFNPGGLPQFTSSADAVRMVKQACFSWSLRYNHKLDYRGITDAKYIPGAITVNYADSAWLRGLFNGEVNGLCRYTATRQVAGKWILDGAEIYINSQHRALPDRFAQGTILHEFGHACGIHGHLNDESCVMNTYGVGVDKLTLADMQCLDRFDPRPVEAHPDKTLTCPIVQMADGRKLFVRLDFNDHNSLLMSWSVGPSEQWNPPIDAPVTLGDEVNFHGMNGRYVHINGVVGDIYTGDLRMVMVGETLFLEWAK